MESEHGLYRAKIRNELELVTWDPIHDLMQKIDRICQARGAVKWRERAHEHFSHCTGARQPGHLVLSGVLQNEDPIKPGPLGRGESSLSVPRSSIHPYVAILESQNDAIVTQDLRMAEGVPETCGRALTGARMSEKKLPPDFGIYQSAAVKFNPQTVASKIIGNE